MRHVSLTCKNHPELRWSCKEIAWTGGYNGARNLFFKGEVVKDGEGKPVLYGDRSGVEARVVTKDNRVVEECSCSADDLTLAPENGEIG